MYLRAFFATLRNSSPSLRNSWPNLCLFIARILWPQNRKINLGFQVKLGVLDPKAASTVSEYFHAGLHLRAFAVVDRRLPAGRCSVRNMDLGLARRFPRLSVTDPRQR